MNRISKGLLRLLMAWVAVINLHAQPATLSTQSSDNELLAIRPNQILNTPEILLNSWVDNAIPASLYSKQEANAQKHINETTADAVQAYSPLSWEKQWAAIDYEEITPLTWKWVDLELRKADNSLSKISLRRPNWWLKGQEMDKVGNQAYLDMPEMGLSGFATVKNIRINQLDTRFWDENREGDYVSRPITGKFEHESNDVYYLHFGDTPEPLGVTGAHPIWSIDRNGWIKASELRIGEKVKTQKGLTILKSRVKSESTQKVYNLEIYKDHNFLVSVDRVLVHNTCDDGWIAKDVYSTLPKEVKEAFEAALEKGAARGKGESGIKRLSGPGRNHGGTVYQYELKTPPGSQFGNHRLYGNLEKWTNPKGVTEERVIFRAYNPSAH